MPDGLISPETIVDRIKKKFERQPRISDTSLRLLDDAYKRWKLESQNPTSAWRQRAAEKGLNRDSGLASIDRTIELSWFLFFEIEEFRVNEYIGRSRKPKEEIKKRSREYGQLLKDSIKFQKWLKPPLPKNRPPIAIPGDYLKEHCLAMLADNWDERLQGTPMTTLKLGRQFASFK